MIDRLFLLRYEDRLLYLPRSPALAAAAGPAERGGTRYPIRADHSFDAFSHQRQLLATIPGHAAAGDCKACPVQAVVGGDIDAVLATSAELGVDVKPRADLIEGEDWLRTSGADELNALDIQTVQFNRLLPD